MLFKGEHSLISLRKTRSHERLSVNIGGWLVTEPFITPALYQKYPGTTDEWSLSLAMRADTAGGGINQMEEHYKTFFVSFFFFGGAAQPNAL